MPGRCGCLGRVPSLLDDKPPCWQLFTRAGTHGGHLEAAIGLKAELETALRKSRELNIEPEGPRRREVSGGDWVEVARVPLWSEFSPVSRNAGLWSNPGPPSLGLGVEDQSSWSRRWSGWAREFQVPRVGGGL